MTTRSTSATRIAKRAAALFAGSLLLGVLTAGAPAYGEDAPAQAPAKAGARWTLSMTHSTLKRVVVDDEKTFYYMVFDVTNSTGLPRPWRPLVVGKTDTLHPPYVAGGYSPAVKEIRRVEGKPDLQPIEQSGWQPGEAGKIKSGEKKTLVAVFGPIDPHWSRFRVEVSGLVNPAATLKVNKYSDKQYTVFDTAYVDRNERVLRALREEAAKSGGAMPTPTSEYREVVEDRAFVMVFGRAGDEFQPDDDPITFVAERWEILGEPVVIKVIPSKV